MKIEGLIAFLTLEHTTLASDYVEANGICPESNVAPKPRDPIAGIEFRFQFFRRDAGDPQNDNFLEV
jgi:hypothetical protein